MEIAIPKNRVLGKWPFLGVFAFACFLFWWLPSILYRLFVNEADAVTDESILISVVALILFGTGYLFPVFDRPTRQFPKCVLDSCGDFAYRAAVFLAVPALVVSAMFWHSHVGMEYGNVAIDPIPSSYQAVLYAHLFVGFMFLGTADPEHKGWRRVLIASTLVILPRLVISLHWGRFFLAQAVVPEILIAIARGWIRFSFKRLLQLAAIVLAILFGPAVTRGDFSRGQSELVSWFAAGSSLQLFQDNRELSLAGRCPPLLVSLTAKTIPYQALNECVIELGSKKGIPASLAYILTANDPRNSNGIVSGTGSNYLLELYLSGGIVAIGAGSIMFGFIARRFLGWIGTRSLFSGIWAECLTRALFAPRNDLGYVFERIPSLVLSTWIVVLIVLCGRILHQHTLALQAPQKSSRRAVG